MSTPADSGQGGGTGLGLYSQPYYQQKQTNFNQTVARAAGAGQAYDTGGSNTDALGRSYGSGGSVGSFPAGPNTPIMTTGKNPDIYMGVGSPIAFMKLNDAVNMYYQWDNKTRNQFMSQLSLAGYDVSGLKDEQLAKLWGGYVGVAAQYQANGKSVSPWDVIGKDIAQRESVQPRTVMSTQKMYNISTYEDALGLFTNVAQQLMGRAPTKAETSKLKGILNAYEQAHPSTTEIQSTYMGSQLQDRQAVKTIGGVTQEARTAIAESQAKANPEYGAYQAATNGMNWLMEMIGGH